MAVSIKNQVISSRFKLNNVGIYNQTAAGVFSIIDGQQVGAPLRRRREPFRREVVLFNGSSLPLSRMFHTSDDSSIDRTLYQVPYILPHSSWISPVQEEVLVGSNPRPIRVNRHSKLTNSVNPRTTLLNSRSQSTNFVSPRPNRVNFHSRSTIFFNSRANHVNFSMLHSNSKLENVDLLGKRSHSRARGFCGVANSDGESEEDVQSDESVGVKSVADGEEVKRVCNVIEELFALDRNMEAVLDECRVNLTHDLVMDVLERFRHARKPAFRFFSWAGKQPGFSHDSRTYNSMMSVLGKTKQFETMISLLDEMGEKGLLTLETFQICIKAFAAAQQRKKAVGIFELMKKYNFKIGVDSINCLLDNLGKAKLGKEAQLLFEKLKGRFTPNIQTYTVLLNGWCKVGNLLEAGNVWNEMIDKKLNPDIVAHNIMLEGLLKIHKRSDAVKLFEIMKAKGPSPNARSYTIMIRDLCKQKRMKDAVECYENMLNHGCMPDAAVYTCLIQGFGNQKQMDKVYGLLKEMKENGCPPDGRMYNALIKLMTNRQMPDDAVRIYKKMIQNGIEPSIHTYNMMIKSFFRAENYDMGHAVWEEMSEKGICPDDNSYVVFIGGLIRQGRSMEACKYLEEMIEKGMKPPQLDYNKFAADFSRAGKTNILEELALKMRVEGKVEASDIFSKCSEIKKTGMNFNFGRNPVV